MKFKKVAVLKGGVSSEREISMRSGAAVASGLRAAGYEVAETDVTERKLELAPDIEAVFIALHGEFGEDGEVQELLEEMGVPYTGAGPKGSRLAFDKILSKERFVRHGIPTAPYETPKTTAELSLPLPVVVKPARQGSSIGVQAVFSAGELESAFRAAAKFGGGVLVESYIDGRELTVGIVDGKVLPVVEIRTSSGRYDYEAKYIDHSTQYLVPAPLTQEQAERCGRVASAVFNALECRGLGRVDMRMNKNGEIFVLELNTIPGFTETSLLPKAAKAAGLNFPSLCDCIMRTASLEHKRKKTSPVKEGKRK